VVLEATARTDKGETVTLGKKEYREIGLDLDGNQRMGSWQIKEIIDLSLQPGKNLTERFVKELPEGTESAEIEIRVSLWPDPKTELVAHRLLKKISFGPRP
jgi:hypothetical protein